MLKGSTVILGSEAVNYYGFLRAGRRLGLTSRSSTRGRCAWGARARHQPIGSPASGCCI